MNVGDNAGNHAKQARGGRTSLLPVAEDDFDITAEEKRRGNYGSVAAIVLGMATAQLLSSEVCFFAANIWHIRSSKFIMFSSDFIC